MEIKIIQLIVSVNSYTLLTCIVFSLQIKHEFCMFSSIRQILILGIYLFICTSVSTFICVLTSFQVIPIICHVIYLEIYVKFISRESVSCCMVLSPVLQADYISKSLQIVYKVHAQNSKRKKIQTNISSSSHKT